MLGVFSGSGGAVSPLRDHLEQQNVLRDPQALPHLADILAQAHKVTKIDDINHVSNLVKQSKATGGQSQLSPATTAELPLPLIQVPTANRPYLLSKFASQHEQLRWAGVGLTREEAYLIDKHTAMVAEQNQAEEVRFWGKVLGSVADYYVLQGRALKEAGLEEVPSGAERRGEGVNYYTYWVSNSLLSDQWDELPLITP